jgi:hypothetical protein
MALILAGAAAWFWMNNDPKRESVLSTAQDTVSELRKSLTEPGSPTGPQGQPGQNAGQAQGQTPGQTPGQNQAQGQVPDQALGQAQGQTPGQTPGQNADQAQNQAPGQAQGQNAEQGQARGQAAVPAGAAHPGRAVAGTPSATAVPAPAGLGNQAAWGIVSNEPQRLQDPGLAGRQDDAVVRPTFIDDLANWLVDNYVPAGGRGGRGSIGIDIQSANARYGTGMKGLAWSGDDLSAGRAEALRYV